jgi:hypothetical protein
LITRDLLRSLRNDLPMAFTIQQLGNQAPYSKWDEGRLRVLCPYCHELRAAVNPRNNLAHCFHCGKNFNNIDLLMKSGYAFLDAVVLLQDWLRHYRAAQVVPDGKNYSHPANEIEKRTTGPTLIGPILRRELENHRPSR